MPVVRSARAAAGRTTPFEFVVNVWAQAGTDVEQAERRLRWEIAPYLAVPTYRPAAVTIAGEDAVDRAAAVWRTGGRAAAAPAVPQQLIDALLVHGGAADFARRLAAFGAAGVDAVRLVPLTSLGGGIDAAHDVIDVLGELEPGRIRCAARLTAGPCNAPSDQASSENIFGSARRLPPPSTASTCPVSPPASAGRTGRRRHRAIIVRAGRCGPAVWRSTRCDEVRILDDFGRHAGLDDSRRHRV